MNFRENFKFREMSLNWFMWPFTSCGMNTSLKWEFPGKLEFPGNATKPVNVPLNQSIWISGKLGISWKCYSTNLCGHLFPGKWEFPGKIFSWKIWISGKCYFPGYVINSVLSFLWYFELLTPQYVSVKKFYWYFYILLIPPY